MTATAPLHQHHQHCDELFATAEAAVADQDWAAGEQALAAFITEMERHFHCEEECLFPAFEAATGMTAGPTQVMRMEHVQISELMQNMRAALNARDGDDFAGLAETLLILMQQHNMKEENILYPMCDQHVPETVALQVAGWLNGVAVL
jgi:iron-sulfur cluster repair protein YtfE (RIC family)